jgi:hypothetical protein
MGDKLNKEWAHWYHFADALRPNGEGRELREAAIRRAADAMGSDDREFLLGFLAFVMFPPPAKRGASKQWTRKRNEELLDGLLELTRDDVDLNSTPIAQTARLLHERFHIGHSAPAVAKHLLELLKMNNREINRD